MEKENYYPKSNELLYSMALRSDHGFGMYEKEEQDKIIVHMEQLYEAYVAGKSDEQIAQELNSYVVTIRQVREEVNGKGFFQPTEEAKSFYQKFKK